MRAGEGSDRTDLTRRDLVANVGKGLVTLGLAPGLAKPQAEGAFERLSSKERATLTAFAEVLLPGAADAGVVPYVEAQLASANPLLFVRYLDYPESLVSFYRQGLRALEKLSEMQYEQAFTHLTFEHRRVLARELSQKNPADWSGPPGPLFYLAVRNDAVDVYYGTQHGHERLGIPYLALIPPPKPW